MPRGRMLNKKISLNKTLPKLSIYSQLLFTWCIPHLDILGKIEADPVIIKGKVVPYLKDFTLNRIKKSLQELHNSGLVLIYGDDYKYIKFSGFEEEQTLNPSKESPSIIPDPTPEQLQSDSGITPPEVKLSKVKLSISKDKYKCIPPSLEEVKGYFLTNGYSPEAAQKAFDYYSAAGWHDSGGKPVRSWKQKMIAVWFKEENRAKSAIPLQKMISCPACRKLIPDWMGQCSEHPIPAIPDSVKNEIEALSEKWKA